ncbi:MAG: hypothetical protein WBD22_09690 [Pyrinomonadaceae bacterium]
MNNQLFKRTIVAILFVILMVQTSVLGNSRSGIPDRIITDYSKLADLFIADCDDLDDARRPSGERLRRCLTISKELFDKLNNFSKRLEELVAKIRRGGKWNAALDAKFLREASRHGVDAETLAAVKQAGGLRAFYDKAQRELKSSRPAMEAEIKELESKVAASDFQGSDARFVMASFVPESNVRFIGALKRVAKVAYKIAVAIIAACELSGGFCD